MTISITASACIYTGDGSTVAFDVKSGADGIYFETASELTVTLRSGDTITAQTIATHYTVAGAGSAAGVVTFLTAPTSGVEVRIERNTPLTQTLSLTQAGAFSPTAIMGQLDKHARAMQDLRRIAGGSGAGTYDAIPLTLDPGGDSWDGDDKPIKDVADPTNAQDVVTKAYGDANYGGASVTLAAASAAAAAASAASALASGFTWNYSTSTSMSDPGSGRIRFNHATLASVTAIAIDDLSADSGTPDVSPYVLSWDSSTNTDKGTLLLREVASLQNWVQFTVTGVTDNSGWSELAVTYLNAGGSLVDNDALLGTFTRSGDKGTDGVGSGDVTAASTFGTDNRLVRSDGTGKGVQSSAVTVDDSANMSGIAALSPTTIELGHASDTTLARSSAGNVSVEGNVIYRAGGTDVPIADGGTGQSTAAAGFDALAPTTTRGDIIFRNATTNARLAAGTAGQVLQANGAGTDPTWVTPVGGTAATQAEQETGSSTTVFTTPGRQHFHPGSAKAWVKFNASGTVAASYNITSVTDHGAGSWTINIATDFSSANYCGVAFAGDRSGALLVVNLVAAAAAGTFQISGRDATDSAADPLLNELYAVFFGDHT